MELVPTTFESFCSVDEFWQKVGTMEDSDGSLKYPQLFALKKYVVSLSHGSAVPERDFSMNKIILESHGYITDNDSIVALILVKDSIGKEDGEDKFPITRKLLNYSFKSYAKYQEYLASKRREDERERNLKFQKETASAAADTRKKELEAFRNEIEKCKL